MAIIKLFRGDKICNEKTEPDLFRANGLRTVAFGSGGNSRNLENTGILNSVKFHVIHNSKKKKAYYNISDYLSFTESYDRAKYWCSEKNNLALLPAIDYQETRYIFEVDINQENLEEIEEGIYSFKYFCNFKLRKPDSNDNKSQRLYNLMNREQVCPICRNSDHNHELILINSYKFLKANKEFNISPKELEFSKNDEEWLLLPNDKEMRTGQRLTRIPRADYWKVQLFRVDGEIRPEKFRI